MSDKHITLISLFDEISLNKLERSIEKSNKNFCKVPFREEDRTLKDTLPYHFTFSVWNANEEDLAVNVINQINFKEIQLIINGVEIKESYNNSWNLYFKFERNNELYELQKRIYELAKIEKFNPNLYIPHITIHCDKDYNKMLNIKENIMNEFNLFKVTFNKIGLYRIYPAEMIESKGESV